MRLVGGTLPREGRLEIYHDGKWGTICDDFWDDKDASVACRHLGYGDNGIALHRAKFGAGSGPIWLDNVDCSGSEEHIEDCKSNDWGENNCEHNEDAGVSCNSGKIQISNCLYDRSQLVLVYLDIYIYSDILTNQAMDTASMSRGSKQCIYMCMHAFKHQLIIYR